MLIKVSVTLLFECVNVGTCLAWHMWGQKYLSGVLSPFSLLGLGTELRSSGLWIKLMPTVPSCQSIVIMDIWWIKESSGILGVLQISYSFMSIKWFNFKGNTFYQPLFIWNYGLLFQLCTLTKNVWLIKKITSKKITLQRTVTTKH